MSRTNGKTKRNVICFQKGQNLHKCNMHDFIVCANHNKCLPLRKLKPVQIFYGGTAGKQFDCGVLIKKLHD